MVLLKTNIMQIFLVLLINIIFFFNNAFGSIIYEKGDIIITDFDLDYFIEYHNEIYSVNISKSKALKELILIKKVINKLVKNQSETIRFIDSEIKRQIGEEIFKNKDLLDFNRFLVIKNQYISEYYQNSLNLEDLAIIKNSIKDQNINLSLNNCMTITKTILAKDISNFENILFEKLKQNIDKSYLIKDNQNYQICFNQKILLSIESELIKLIESRISDSFEKLIYEK